MPKNTFLSIDDSADTLKLLFTMVSYPLTEKYYDESYATWKAHLEKLLPIDGINVKSILWEKLFKYIFACLNGFYYWTISKIGRVIFGRIKNLKVSLPAIYSFGLPSEPTTYRKGSHILTTKDEYSQLAPVWEDLDEEIRGIRTGVFGTEEMMDFFLELHEN